MRARSSVLALLVLALIPARSAAADPPVRFRAGLELGLVASPREGARRDLAGFANLVPAAVFHPAPRWELSIGATIPVAPILDLQLPIALEYAASRHAVLRVALRPSYAIIDLCGSGTATCPLDDAASPTDRGGSAAGAFGEAGVAYRFYLGTPWSSDAPPFELDLRAGYLGGAWLWRGGANEQPIGGAWQGFVLGADMTF